MPDLECEFILLANILAGPLMELIARFSK